MRALSIPNIESELSYAYLHAVASKAGMACTVGNRHEDGNGIDARITAWAPFPNGGYLTEVDIKVQLKATVMDPSTDETHISYFLKGVGQYNDLRTESVEAARILVVLFLPADAGQWLTHTVEQLAFRRCAYWQSLRKAPATANDSGATVRLPKNQMFTPEALLNLAARLSRRDFPVYTA
jgi:hypothetical protein